MPFSVVLRVFFVASVYGFCVASARAEPAAAHGGAIPRRLRLDGRRHLHRLCLPPLAHRVAPLGRGVARESGGGAFARGVRCVCSRRRSPHCATTMSAVTGEGAAPARRIPAETDVWAEWVGGKPLIHVGAALERGRRGGLHPGQEVVSVHGVAVERVVRAKLAPPRTRRRRATGRCATRWPARARGRTSSACARAAPPRSTRWCAPPKATATGRRCSRARSARSATSPTSACATTWAIPAW
jgi:hypothetical protein